MFENSFFEITVESADRNIEGLGGLFSGEGVGGAKVAVGIRSWKGGLRHGQEKYS